MISFEIIATNGQRSVVTVPEKIETKRQLTEELQRQGVLPLNAKVKLWRQVSAVEAGILTLENK